MELNLIKSTLAGLTNQKSLLDMLMEFERTIENTGLYSYLNWENGEIVQGPDISKYWITVKLMYPASKMPDPRGGQRLEKLGCKVEFKEDTFKKPKKVFNVQDWSDPASKKALLVDVPVWIVTIKMPARYINIHNDADDAAKIDTFSNDLASSYDGKE
jgi:hypothetical protein